MNPCIWNQLYGEANRSDEGIGNDKRWQPIKVGCQIVAKAIGPVKLLSKDKKTLPANIVQDVRQKTIVGPRAAIGKIDLSG